MKWSTTTFSLLCLLALLAQTLRTVQAQIATSELTGVVTDSSGAGVPNAKVTITSNGTGFSRSVSTNAAGQYSIPDLTPGAYGMTVVAGGFKVVSIRVLNLYVGRTSTQDIQLEVGAQIQQVTVQAEAPLLTTSNGQVGTVIAGPVITQLPLNGRNFMALAMMSPGTGTNKNGNNATGATYDPSVVMYNVNGHTANDNMYMLDGVEIKDFEDGPTLFQPSVDALQEFQVTTSNYSAVYGTEAAGQINIATKSGSNQFHAAAWEFLRNNHLDAANFFQGGPAPDFKRNQVGGNIGGPVILPKYNGKDQTFFFFNYETYRQVREVPETAEYPTLAELNGNLSDLVPNGQLINPSTGTAFPGSVIPTSMIRPASLEGFLNNGIGHGPWIPAPNVTGQAGYNYVRNAAYNYFDNQYMTRIDRKLTDQTTLYGHFTFDTQFRDDPENTPQWEPTNQITDYSIGGHVTHTFGPSVVFDTAVGLNHFMQNVFLSTEFKNNITNSILGINGNCLPGACWGAPTWSVAGYSGLGEGQRAPREWWVNTFELRPILTVTKGNHLIRMGMDFSRTNENFPEVLNRDGAYNFDGQFSGSALGDFLLDLPQSVSSAPQPFAPDIYSSDIEPYFQDDWKVSSRLTLNLGLRYTWIGIPLSKNHRSIANVYFPASDGVPELVVADGAGPITFGGVTGTLFTGVPFLRASSVGLPPALIFNDNRDWSPRFGFAYRLGTTAVLRGGYGLFYSMDMMDKYIEASVNLPFIDSLDVVLDNTNFQSFDPLNPYTSVPGANSYSAAQVWGNQIKHKMGRANEWNLTLEQTWHNTLFSLAYVGVVSDHLPDDEDPNQAVPGSGSVISRRRWPTGADMTIVGENSISNYNGLQAHAQHNFSDGVALLASYTWSKTLDTGQGVGVGEGGYAAMDEINQTSMYGLAGQDIRQRLTVSYVYQLPLGRGKRFLSGGGLSNTFLGGWQINGTTSANSGSPLTEFQAFNVDNSDAGTNRADQIGNPNDLSHSRPRGQQVAEFFDTSAFRKADLTNGTYRFGNAGRNTIIGPGTYDWDFALFKSFQIRERGKGQFRVETFNLFNRPIFAQPGSTFGTPENGAITSTSNDSREIQLALRFEF